MTVIIFRFLPVKMPRVDLFNGLYAYAPTPLATADINMNYSVVIYVLITTFRMTLSKALKVMYHCGLLPTQLTQY